MRSPKNKIGSRVPELPRIGGTKVLRYYLRQHRKTFPGLSQGKLGLRFEPNVEKGQVSKWEKMADLGTISTDRVNAYAAALGVDPEVLQRPPGAEAPLDTVAREKGVDRSDVLTAIEILSAQKKAASR